MKNEDYKKLEIAQHNVILENRERMSISGVSEVISFDEREITLVTNGGVLSVSGEELHVEKLNLELGELSVEGRIEAVIYQDDRRRGGFWSRLF